MLKWIKKIFNQKEKLKKLAIESDDKVLELLTLIKKGDDIYKEEQFGFDYFITDDMWFFNQKTFLGFFFEEDIVYVGIVQRDTGFSILENDDNLRYYLKGPVYKFKKEHELFIMFDSIKKNLEKVYRWEREKEPLLDQKNIEIKQIETKIQNTKYDLEKTEERIQSAQMALNDFKNNPRFLQLKKDVLLEKDRLTKELKRFRQELKQAEMQKEALKKEYDALKNKTKEKVQDEIPVKILKKA